MDNAKANINITQMSEMGLADDARADLQKLKENHYSNSEQKKVSIPNIKRAIASWRTHKLSKKRIPRHEDISKDINA